MPKFIKPLPIGIAVCALSFSYQAHSTEGDDWMRSCTYLSRQLNPQQPAIKYQEAQLACLVSIAAYLRDIRSRLPLTSDGNDLRVKIDDDKK